MSTWTPSPELTPGTATPWSGEDIYRGPVGPLGPQGPDGPEGPKGPTGPQGLAGNVVVGTVTTSNPGSAAAIENVGTPTNAILNITLPRGDTGPEGPEGPEGPQGDVATVVAGQNIIVDSTDSANPIVKTTDDLTANNIYSPSMVGGIYGALNKLHIQNYSPGLGYYTQNLRRNGDTSWSLDWGVDYGVGIGLDASNTAAYPGINFMGCAIGYSGVQPTKALMTPAGDWGFGTTAPTAKIDNAGSTRLRGELRDKNNFNGAGVDRAVATSAGADGFHWVDSSLYHFYGYKTGASVTGLSGNITNFNQMYSNDGSFNATTGVYTAPVTGLYTFQFNAFKHNTVTAAEIRFKYNGSALGVRSYADTGANTWYTPMSIHWEAYLTAGNTVQVACTVGLIHNNESCCFSGRLLRKSI